MIDWSDPEATKRRVKPTVTRTEKGWLVHDPLALMLTDQELKERRRQALTDLVSGLKIDDDPPLPLPPSKPWVPK